MSALTQSERISRLMFLAFVATGEPAPLLPDGTALLSWSDAMELYADAVRAEALQEEKLAVPPVIDRFQGLSQHDQQLLVWHFLEHNDMKPIVPLDSPPPPQPAEEPPAAVPGPEAARLNEAFVPVTVRLEEPAKPADTHTHTQRGGPKPPRLTAEA